MNLSIQLYQSISEKDEPRVYEHWHASSISDCPRAHFFKRKGVKPLETPTAARLIRWRAGHLMEEAIRPHIQELYPEALSNQRFTSEEMDLTGEYDNYHPDTKTIIEVKSVHDHAFKEFEGDLYLKEKIGTHPNGNNMWGPKETPYFHHELQNHAYVLLLREQGIEVENIHYVYVSLGGRIATYKTEVQPKILKNVEQRLAVLNNAWEDDKAPVCICDPEHFLYPSVMQFCDYRTEDGCCDKALLEEE